MEREERNNAGEKENTNTAAVTVGDPTSPPGEFVDPSGGPHALSHGVPNTKWEGRCTKRHEDDVRLVMECIALITGKDDLDWR